MLVNVVVLVFFSSIAIAVINTNAVVVNNLVFYILQSDYKNCLVLFIQRQKYSVFDLLQPLSEQNHPYSIKNFINSSNVSSTVAVRKIPLRFTRNDCNLVILDLSTPEILDAQLEFITQYSFPNRLHQTRLIFMKWNDATANTSKLLLQKKLRDVPLKMEIQLVKSNHGYDRALLLGFCEFCNRHNSSGSNFSNNSSTYPNNQSTQVIGGYDEITGYWRHSNYFPQATIFGMTNISVIFPLEFFKRHRFIRPRLAFSQLQRVLFQVVSSLWMVLDHSKVAFTNSDPIGSEYHRELDDALKKNRMSLALIYFLDELNSHRLQTTTHYTYYRRTIIYRKMRKDTANLFYSNFREPVINYFIPLSFGASIIILLSRRWDLVTRFRLPKPINDMKWRRHGRKSRLWGNNCKY